MSLGDRKYAAEPDFLGFLLLGRNRFMYSVRGAANKHLVEVLRNLEMMFSGLVRRAFVPQQETPTQDAHPKAGDRASKSSRERCHDTHTDAEMHRLKVPNR